VLLKLAGILKNRVVKAIVRKSERGSFAEREKRAQALAQVAKDTANVVIVVGGVMMALQVMGIPVTAVLGGAAVVGLAVSFGAQNLIRDYFAGFIILLENQYGINDVIKICGIAGLVERITLRITVLRDLEGVAHFIPNGEIKSVSNMTHGWSRALFDIGVAYKEEVDKVMDVLMELGKEVRQDPKFGHLILDDPEMLGVDAFGDSAVVIKFFIKTRPLQQWTVKREMLRRIKNRFDELGIEIPFPHRTVYFGNTEAPPPDAAFGPSQ
jgi:small conductance mechanosensitive channel